MPKLPVLYENVNISAVASWCPLVSHRLTHGENQHYLCWTRREDKQCITVTVTTVTSYSDRVYYWTFVRDVVVKNGHYNKIVHHLTLIETLCVTCRVTMLLSLNQTDMWPPNSPDLNPVDYAVWETLQQLVYQHRSFTSVAELKQAINLDLFLLPRWSRPLSRAAATFPAAAEFGATSWTEAHHITSEPKYGTCGIYC